MDHIKSLLTSNEVVLVEGRQHWMALLRFAIRPILLGLAGIGLMILSSWVRLEGLLAFLDDLLRLVTIIVVLVAVVWLPIDAIRWSSRQFVLTNRRTMRIEGVARKRSLDASLEQINDVRMEEPLLGRLFGYADLTILTASSTAEEFRQLIDGLQFKKAVMEAKEALRVNRPLESLPEGFVVKGGTNEASLRAQGKLREPASVHAQQGADQASGETPAASVPAVGAAGATAATMPGVEPAVVAAATEEPPASFEAEPGVAVEPEPEPAVVAAATEEPPASFEAEPGVAVEPEPEPEQRSERSPS
jgi:hypothetical protein